MLIKAMFDCRYKLDQIRVSYYKLKGAKEMKICAEPQSRRLDWIQVTGFKDQNQAETLESPDLKNPVEWMVIQVTGC